MRKFLFFWMMAARASFGQTNDFAESFYFFPSNISLLVPSYSGTNADVQANMAYKSYFGQLSAIRTYMTDFHYNIQKKDKPFPEHDKHMLGGGFYTEREGDFITRNRLFVRYAWHTKLSEQLHLSGGTAFHSINYLFKTSSAGTSGSDFAFSGQISAAIYTSSFKLGFSSVDFNQPSLTPIDVPTKINTCNIFHVEKSLEIGDGIKLTGSARANIMPAGYNTTMLHFGANYLTRFGLHAFTHNIQGYGFAFELNHLEIENSWIDMSFAYKIPYPTGSRIPYSTFEINLGYYLLKNSSTTNPE